MRYIERPTMFVEAEQWLKNGDHSLDESVMMDSEDGPFKSEGNLVRYFRHPNVAGDSVCEICNCTMHVHGWIDPARVNTGNAEGRTVCPGSYVIAWRLQEDSAERTVYHVMPQRNFEAKYMLHPKLNPAEALFGFLSWLSSREQPIAMSSRHSPTDFMPALAKFLDVQGLGECSKEWPDNMISMKDHPVPEAFTKELVKVLPMDGMQRINAERHRQQEKEGYDHAHDDEHVDFELTDAAQCYLMVAMGQVEDPSVPPEQWPWAENEWKPSTRIRNLEKAGGLLMAEKERLERLDQASGDGQGHNSHHIEAATLRIQNVAKMIDEAIANAPEISFPG